MNYRHDFHAGNFADVFKHIFLTRILLYLKQKPSAFRYIDTHAGTGSYDLASTDSLRTNEWRKGIERLLDRVPCDDAFALIEPYLSIVRPYFKGLLYPGSPLIARELLRDQDKLILCELQAATLIRLKSHFSRAKTAKVIEIDAYLALSAFLPPVERRGLVLIDPPFEHPQEFENLCGAIRRAWAKWQTGIFMIWYPVKDTGRVESFLTGLKMHEIKRMLRLEIQTEPFVSNAPLSRCGLLFINPPFTLAEEAEVLLPTLTQAFGLGARSNYLIEWLSGE